MAWQCCAGRYPPSRCRNWGGCLRPDGSPICSETGAADVLGGPCIRRAPTLALRTSLKRGRRRDFRMRRRQLVETRSCRRDHLPAAPCSSASVSYPSPAWQGQFAKPGSQWCSVVTVQCGEAVATPAPTSASGSRARPCRLFLDHPTNEIGEPRSTPTNFSLPASDRNRVPGYRPPLNAACRCGDVPARSQRRSAVARRPGDTEGLA